MVDSMNTTSDIILTGVPRSGTTLTCHLLNKLPEVVALHEPMHPPNYFGISSDEIVAEIKKFFNDQRATVLNNGTAISKSASGVVPDNPVGSIDEQTGKRKKIINGRKIVVTKPLGIDFKLVIKHPSMFTAIMEIVKYHFPCFAIIRNPLSVLLSWNSVTFSQSLGHAPAAEGFDANLSNSLKKEKNLYLRQLILLDWYFSKYKHNLTNQQILKYEDIVSTGGKALLAITESASQLNEPLKSNNINRVYNWDNVNYLVDLLLNSNGSYLNYYNKREILGISEIAQSFRSK